MQFTDYSAKMGQFVILSLFCTRFILLFIFSVSYYFGILGRCVFYLLNLPCIERRYDRLAQFPFELLSCHLCHTATVSGDGLALQERLRVALTG